MRLLSDWEDLVLALHLMLLVVAVGGPRSNMVALCIGAAAVSARLVAALLAAGHRLRGLSRALSPGRDLDALARVLDGSVRKTSPHTRPRTSIPPRRSNLPSLEDHLAMPDNQIDLAAAALAFAAETEPGLDTGAHLAEVHRLSALLEAELAGDRDPWAVVLATNRLLFYREGFGPDRLDRGQRNTDNLLLSRVLERKRGYCLGLSTLYLAVTQRLGLPFYGVSLPRHFLVRYEADGERINVETTRKGKHLPDGFYVEKYRLSPEHLDLGVYLGSLQLKQVLVEWLNARGNFRYNQGDREGALADFDRATSLSPNFVAGYLSRGFYFLQRGEPQRAISELRDALRVDGHNLDAHLTIGDAYFRAGDLRRALTHFAMAAELDPRSALAATNLGRVHTRTGDYARAEAEQARAIKLDPRSSVVWNNLGVLAHARSDARRAQRCFKKALRYDGRFEPALQNLYKLQVSAGKERAAARTLRRIKEL